MHLISTAATYLVATADPGPAAPPGSGKLIAILQWGLYLATLLCVGAVVKAGVQIALAGHGRGGGGEHGMTLLAALAGAVVCGVSAAVVTELFA